MDLRGFPGPTFEQDGFHYTLGRRVETRVTGAREPVHRNSDFESKSKDMEFVLALLPPEKEFITEDGLSGTLSLQRWRP